jgi:microcystin-dependent protein
VTTPYVGEIRLCGWSFAPPGWALCQGQLLQIADYDILYTLVGTTYGGDGMSTFAVPDLRSRVPAHQGGGFVIGQRGGQETVTLSAAQAPQHSHPFYCSLDPAAQRSPAGNVPAALSSGAGSAYVEGVPAAALAPGSITAAPGGSQPHDNMQPYLGLTFIISLFGIYPSQG